MHSILDSVQFSPIECELMGAGESSLPFVDEHRKLPKFTEICRKLPESTRSTQPCIPPGSINRVPALAGVRAGMSPLLGGR